MDPCRGCGGLVAVTDPLLVRPRRSAEVDGWRTSAPSVSSVSQRTPPLGRRATTPWTASCQAPIVSSVTRSVAAKVLFVATGMRQSAPALPRDMTGTSDEQLERLFAARSLHGLLDLWNAPMGARQRRILLAELDARGHRTASLESPHVDDPVDLDPPGLGGVHPDALAVTEPEAIAHSGSLWWRLRRRRFNRGLVIAGAGAFVAYCVVIAMLPERRDIEITLFTMLAQAIACLVYIGLANLCLELGPALDGVIPNAHRRGYRRWAYRLGAGLCFAAPFAVPALLLLQG